MPSVQIAGTTSYRFYYPGTPTTTPVNLTGSGAMGAKYRLDGSASNTVAAESVAVPSVVFSLLPDNASLPEKFRRALVPGSVVFSWAGKLYFDRGAGVLYTDLDTANGSGVIAGAVDYSTGDVSVSSWASGTDIDPPTIIGCLSKQAYSATAFVRFRTPGAPIRPQTLIVRATGLDGTLYTGTAQADGTVVGSFVRGTVNYENGVCEINFGEDLDDADDAVDLSHRFEHWYSADARINYGTDATPIWRVWRPMPVDPDTVWFNVVIYVALPLDADLIGIDPIRLPSDGRVPIFQDGYVAVLHDTQFTTLPSGLTASQVVALPRAALAEVIVRDTNGLTVAGTAWTVNKTSGEITMANPLDLSAYVEPLVAEHRVEDMVLVTDAQITGDLTISRALKHDYTAANSLVSSALLFGDVQSRVSKFFSQQTWTSVWSDSRIGNDTTASYNRAAYPIETVNDGAITQRWALIFTSTTAFNIVGEDVGVIGTGSISAPCAPLNPLTGTAYFDISELGWGAGWAVGNVLRFNTVGALAPIWFARTTKQSDTAGSNDSFRIMPRGNAD